MFYSICSLLCQSLFCIFYREDLKTTSTFEQLRAPLEEMHFHNRSVHFSILRSDAACVNFINILSTNFSQEHRFFYVHTTYDQKKAAKATFAQKTRAYNVDEIGDKCQFHHYLTLRFSYQSPFLAKHYQRKAAQRAFVQKREHKMLIKLTP